MKFRIDIPRMRQKKKVLKPVVALSTEIVEAPFAAAVSPVGAQAIFEEELDLISINGVGNNQDPGARKSVVQTRRKRFNESRCLQVCTMMSRGLNLPDLRS